MIPTPKPLLNGYYGASEPDSGSGSHQTRSTTSSIIRMWDRSLVKQLIQHLVTSNPSPAYVARVSAVFADDGSGVRGNLAAVVRAILSDPEARGDAAGQQ
jgi:uncharacterized protein (DUF1800 family)